MRKKLRIPDRNHLVTTTYMTGTKEEFDLCYECDFDVITFIRKKLNSPKTK